MKSKSIIGILGVILMVIGFGVGALTVKPIETIKTITKTQKGKTDTITNTMLKTNIKTLTKVVYKPVETVLHQTDTITLLKEIVAPVEDVGLIPVDYANDEITISGYLTDTGFVLINFTINTKVKQEISIFAVSRRKDKVKVTTSGLYQDTSTYSHYIKYPLFRNRTNYRKELLIE